MSDNPKLRGKPDRSRVSSQSHEIAYLANKFDFPAPLVRNVQAQVGPSRARVEAYLQRMKDNGRK